MSHAENPSTMNQLADEPVTAGKMADSVPLHSGSCHSPKRKSNGGYQLLIMLMLTFFFFLIELVFGYISKSMALIADSFHMLSDVLALVIAYVCMRIATQDTKKNTFGWVRAEVLGALINGVFLLALCFSIFIEAVECIIQPEMIKEPFHVLVVGVIGLLVNIVGICMFHNHAHGHSHHSHDDSPSAVVDGEASHLINSHQVLAFGELSNGDVSVVRPIAIPAKKSAGNSSQLNMRGVFLHVLGDAIGSVIVIATALVSWLVEGHEHIKLYMDPVLSLCMVFLMVFTTFPLVRETALILLQTTPKYIRVEEVTHQLLQIKGVEAVHEFHVWCLVGERVIATVHIRFSTLQDYLDASQQIQFIFHNNSIHSSTIQPEFPEMGTGHCKLACGPRNCNIPDAKCCDAILKPGMQTSPTINSRTPATLADSVAHTP